LFIAPPKLSIPLPPPTDRTRMTPDGIVRFSPVPIAMLLVIVHVLTPFHVPPNVGLQVFSSTVPPVACAS